MGLLGALLGAGRHLVAMQRDLDESIKRVPRALRARADSRLPQTFAVFRDPQERFELSYPAEWKFETAAGSVQVFSERLGGMARVDVEPESPTFWEDLRKKLAQAGGESTLEGARPGHPEHARGVILVGKKRFGLDLYAYRTPAGIVVLSTFNVEDARRGAALEKYEDGIMKRIRNHFKVALGG